jgi:hypothetical protein
MDRQACVAHITARLEPAVQELFVASSAWAAGRQMLELLIVGRGTGHAGQSHRDASGQERRSLEFLRASAIIDASSLAPA